MNFRDFINEGLFSRKPKDLSDNIKTIFRVVTDIVSSWNIEGKYIVGDGTDMKDVAEADLKRVQKQFPGVDFELFEKRKNYYAIRTKNTKETLDFITKKGYK